MPEDKAIILFDGVCNLCSGAVQFVLLRDKNAFFRFASLQSASGRKILNQFNLNVIDNESIVLIENGQAYTASEAALRISRKLNGGWPLLFGLIIIPRFFRDDIYFLVARNRYKWFGKRNTCLIFLPQYKERFIL